jgi:hypothetical protein
MSRLLPLRFRLGYDVSLESCAGRDETEGVIPLTPNEKRTAEDRRECCWLYVVTCCKRSEGPRLMTIKDPAQLNWNEIRKIDHYVLSVKNLAK